MFATLTAVDYSGHPGPALAESVTVGQDGKVWTVKLREGLKWSDGEPLTNADVIFTVDLIQSPAVNTIYEANLEGVRVGEDAAGNLVFSLTASYADFISALAIPIVPKHILAEVPVKTLAEAPFSNAPITSGAFSYNAMQVTGVEGESVYYLSPNPNYYLGEPMLSSFAVHTYADKEGVSQAINTGTVTATAELSSPEAAALTTTAFEIRHTSINSGAFIFFNTNNSTLASLPLRMALRQGIDLAALREQAPGTVALDYPLLASQIELKNYPPIPAYDLAAARNAIQGIAAGQELRINIATVDSGYLPAVATKLAEQLRLLGIESEVSVYPESQDFVTNVVSRRNYGILLYEIELGSDPDPLAYFHSSQAGAAGLNLANYRNALVDDLLVGARETTDATLRARKYETFLNYFVEDVPAIGLYQANLTYVYNRNVRAYGEQVRLVTGLDRFVDVTNWAAAKGMRNKTP